MQTHFTESHQVCSLFVLTKHCNVNSVTGVKYFFFLWHTHTFGIQLLEHLPDVVRFVFRLFVDPCFAVNSVLQVNTIKIDQCCHFQQGL